MNVTCADCASIFRVDPAKVPDAGVLARCAVCGAVLTVRVESASPTSEPALATGATPAAPSQLSPAVEAPAAATPERGQEVAPTPARPSPRIAPRAATPAAAPATIAPESRAPESRAAEATVTSPVTDAAQPAAGRRFNPYLSNDPSQKARRLARALVSDLVAYHPQKREEGLRAGTLKELFRDEIRKSWDEYVEQVGAPIAEGTTHFQDALNDVLAGGRKMF